MIRIKVLVEFEHGDDYSLAKEEEICLTDEALLAIAEGIKAAQSELCPDCGRNYFENETIVDGELRCSCKASKEGE